MSIKSLQSLANNLPKMALSDRAHGLFEHLADLPDGTFSIDLLNQSISHDGVVISSPTFIKELSDWFSEQCAKEGVHLSYILSASVTISKDTSTVPTDKKRIVHFLSSSYCVITSASKSYEGSVRNVHIWHKREVT